ncbi:Sugar phosphate permease [Gemmobacter megaterium]|uniref:Sugar phosphate permease n=1 Tax=Gemmobacter megaterium TaxID=1086013 RepID=A0A1N7KF82_9RHOB|nr:MFS transporter [Gemmobacter megaterium]GGE01818.1 MFS transporter [Gemmobacter megaterium]SIS60253.1 Sugar phosphate permease [Gemmobacter megaterium]
MRLGIAALVLGYVLSQFYRAFLAVLAPVLQTDLGATPAQLADASGLWFLVFAAMQIPVGIALDRIGPRRTVAVTLGVAGAGGVALFAAAQGPGAIILAMALIGVGCSPVLMSSFYIFARTYSPAVFGTLAGLLIGVGNLGNLGAALPLSLAVEVFGWRGTVGALAVVTLIVAGAMWRFIQDPPQAPVAAGQGGIAQVLRIPSVWAIFLLLAVGYAPSAAIRGLWVGPYFSDVMAASAAQIGTVTLIMGLAMVAGNFAYGPMDRLFGSRKWPNLVGNLAGAAVLLALWWTPAPGWWAAVGLIAAVGFFGMSFPLLMAHGRAFFPPHLVGRGVTVLNLFGIGGVGVMQVLSGRVFTTAAGQAAPTAAYGTLFGFFALIMLAGCVAYAFSRDRTD